MARITVPWVMRHVAKIQALEKISDEEAHSAEDHLYREVLRAIADGTVSNPRACADAALKTWEFEFSRWYA